MRCTSAGRLRCVLLGDGAQPPTPGVCKSGLSEHLSGELQVERPMRLDGLDGSQDPFNPMVVGAMHDVFAVPGEPPGGDHHEDN